MLEWRIQAAKKILTWRRNFWGSSRKCCKDNPDSSQCLLSRCSSITIFCSIFYLSPFCSDSIFQIFASCLHLRFLSPISERGSVHECLECLYSFRILQMEGRHVLCPQPKICSIFAFCQQQDLASPINRYEWSIYHWLDQLFPCWEAFSPNRDQNTKLEYWW